MKFITPTKLLAVAFLATTLCPLATLRANGVTYELAPSAFTLAMVIKEAAPGTFLRNEIGGAFGFFDLDTGVFVPGRVPAFFSGWQTGRVVNGDIPEPATVNEGFVAKIVSTRYGNRELIAELVEAGLIAAPVAGWTLVYVYGDPTADEFEATLVARKSGQVDVPLDILDVDSSGGAYAVSFLYTATYRYNRVGDITSEVATVRGRSNYEYAASLEFAVGDSEASLGGLETGSATDFSYYPDPMDRSIVGYFSVPGAIRYTNLVGATTGEDFEDEETGELFEFFGSLVTGTASIGASRVITKRN